MLRFESRKAVVLPSPTQSASASIADVKSFILTALACCLVLPALAQEQANEDIQVVELQTNDIIYDPIRDKIYASVPSSDDASRANTITTINPNTGEIEASVFVGSEPDVLAISDDGQYLYVGLDGAAAVRRYDIAARSAGLQFSLGTGNHGPSYAEDIEVLPGNANAVAISLYRKGVSPRHDGIAIYDDGVRRGDSTRGHTGGNRIAFSASANVLYGYNNETTEFGLRAIAITSSGAEQISVASDVIRGFGRDIEFAGGVIYATSGAAVDADSLTLLGTYGASGSLAVDADRGFVYFLQGSSLSTFNRATFVKLETESFSGISGSPNSLIQTGANRFAFRAGNSSQVVLVGSAATQPVTGLRVPNIHDSTQNTEQSFLRFHNTDNIEGTVEVTLAGADDGVVQATWTSPIIAPDVSRQFDIATIEQEATDGTVVHQGYFTISASSEFNGRFQHVLWRGGVGEITNVTACETRLKSDPASLMNVHTSRLPAFPATIIVHNTGASEAELSLDVHDAGSGALLGIYKSGLIPANSQISLTASQIEFRAGIFPAPSQFQYNLVMREPFTGTLQHLVTNTATGTVTDMTGYCALTAQ